MAITQTVTAIPQAGHRGVDTRDTFVTKQEGFQDALTNVFVTEINTVKDQLNTTETNINSKEASATTAASTATTKASEASTYRDEALGFRNEAETFRNDAEEFAGKYLGAFASDPVGTTAGQLYFSTTENIMKVYNGATWNNAGSAVNGTADRYTFVVSGTQNTFSASYDVGFVDVFHNGLKLYPTDYTATSGTEIVLNVSAQAGDTVDIIGYGLFSSTALDQLQADVTQNTSDITTANATLDTKLDLAQVQATALYF